MSHFMKFQCSTIYEYDSAFAVPFSLSCSQSLARSLFATPMLWMVLVLLLLHVNEFVSVYVCESMRSVWKIGDTYVRIQCICVLCRCDSCLHVSCNHCICCCHTHQCVCMCACVCIAVSAIFSMYWYTHCTVHTHSIEYKLTLQCKYELKTSELNCSKCSTVLPVSIQYIIIHILLRFH